jgi:hypothetical protein
MACLTGPATTATAAQPSRNQPRKTWLRPPLCNHRATMSPATCATITQPRCNKVQPSRNQPVFSPRNRATIPLRGGEMVAPPRAHPKQSAPLATLRLRLACAALRLRARSTVRSHDMIGNHQTTVDEQHDRSPPRLTCGSGCNRTTSRAGKGGLGRPHHRLMRVESSNRDDDRPPSALRTSSRHQINSTRCPGATEAVSASGHRYHWPFGYIWPPSHKSPHERSAGQVLGATEARANTKPEFLNSRPKIDRRMGGVGQARTAGTKIDISIQFRGPVFQNLGGPRFKKSGGL